jgi:glycosyltransferase involved in cell wall biosynthesis
MDMDGFSEMKPKISFVVPCLNEELTLPFVLKKINIVKEQHQDIYDIEVIVSDNGSIDNSREIALSFGARVCPCEIKGYGAALDNGIRNANGDFVIFADADDTYNWLEAPLLIQEIVKTDVDMVIGSRLDGTIHKGAMPFLHRYLGTPVINFIINLLYAKKDKIKDSNSGFRCFKKESYLKWNIQSKGMEFASELLIKALTNGSRFSHVPVSLYPDKPGRQPHLRTWRDGMRHLLRILLYAPHFFYNLGVFTLILSWSNLIFAFFAGSIIDYYGIRIYGFHSLVLLSFLSIIGIGIWNVGLLIATKQNQAKGLYKKILDVSEEYLFFFLVFGLSIIFTSFSILFWKWKQHNYQFLNFERELIFFASLSLFIVLFSLNAITAHILRRD